MVLHRDKDIQQADTLGFFEYHSRTSNSSSGLFDGGEEGLPYGRDKLKISWVIYA
jgi:hypothetical protein